MIMNYELLGFTYVLIGLLWGVFAYEKQIKLYPEAGDLKSYACFYANVVLWVVAMPIGIYKLFTEKEDG